MGESSNEQVPQGGDPDGVLFQMTAGLFQGRRHAHNGRDILRSCPFAPLLSPALNEVGQRYPLPGIEYADPFRAVELVGREGQQVDVLHLYVNGQVSRRLNRIGMEDNSPLPAHRADFRNRQDGADLVVGIHNRN